MHPPPPPHVPALTFPPPRHPSHSLYNALLFQCYAQALLPEHKDTIEAAGQLREAVEAKRRAVAELQSQAGEQRLQLTRVRNECASLRRERDDLFDVHAKQLEGIFQELGELGQLARLAGADPESDVLRGGAAGLALPEAALAALDAAGDGAGVGGVGGVRGGRGASAVGLAVAHKADEVLRALSAVQVKAHTAVRAQVDAAEARYGDLAKRYRALYGAYRELRYRFEEGAELLRTQAKESEEAAFVQGGKEKGGKGLGFGLGEEEGGEEGVAVCPHEDDVCGGEVPVPPGEAQLRKDLLASEERALALERKLRALEVVANNNAPAAANASGTPARPPPSLAAPAPATATPPPAAGTLRGTGAGWGAGWARRTAGSATRSSGSRAGPRRRPRWRSGARTN